jgi:hypothetical protein
MGTSTFNKELLYSAEKLKYVSNLCNKVQEETISEIIPLLVMEQLRLKETIKNEGTLSYQHQGCPSVNS